MHRCTAPNHIHIFIRFISSNSGTFSRHGTFTPSLAQVAAKAKQLHTQIGSNACSFNTDWLWILHPRLISLLSNFSTGTSGRLGENSCSPAPATWMRDSPWDEPKFSTTTKLSSVLTGKFFFSFKLKHMAIRISSYYMVDLHTFSINLNFSNFDEFVCQQKHHHDLSRMRWERELKISSFQIFKSLSGLNTYIL